MLKSMLKAGLVASLVLGLGGAAMAQMPTQAGPQHEALEQLAGEWGGTATLQLPGMEPMASDITISARRSLNGLWLISDFDGSMMGSAFQGHSVWGFDVEKGKSVEIWVDSFRGKPNTLEGDYDAASKTWTKWLDSKHPMTGADIRERHSVAMTSADSYRMELALPAADGSYQPYMVLEMARAE